MSDSAGKAIAGFGLCDGISEMSDILKALNELGSLTDEALPAGIKRMPDISFVADFGASDLKIEVSIVQPKLPRKVKKALTKLAVTGRPLTEREYARVDRIRWIFVPKGTPDATR